MIVAASLASIILVVLKFHQHDVAVMKQWTRAGSANAEKTPCVAGRSPGPGPKPDPSPCLHPTPTRT